MKLVEVVGVMNPLLRQYGEREVESITDVCKLGVTIWIK